LLRAVLGRALHLPAFRAGLFVAGFACLLGGPSSGTIIAPIVAPIHALCLSVHRERAGKHHDRSQDTNASPKTHHWSHAVLLWCSERRSR
jgi:hypothetical protein